MVNSRAGIEYTGNLREGPRWLGDFGNRDHLMPHPAKMDPTAFRNRNGVQVRVTTNAAADATTLLIDALTPGENSVSVVVAGSSVLIPSGTVLDFGTGKKFARLTANALAGDVTLTVAALPAAIAAGDRAAYAPSGRKVIPSGTVVGRTFAERDASTPFGAFDSGGPDGQIYITLFDVICYDTLPVDVELVRPGAVIKENYLPDWAAFSAPDKAVLRELFNCITGVD